MSWFFLMRARVRLAWAVLTGRVEAKATVGLLLTSLTVKELGAQEEEIRSLRAEITDLRMRLASRAPYR